MWFTCVNKAVCVCCKSFEVEFANQKTKYNKTNRKTALLLESTKRETTLFFGALITFGWQPKQF